MLSTLITLLLSLTVCGQQANQMTLEQWNKEAKTNIRLLPKYGHAVKTAEQKKSDKEFVETTLKQHSTKRAASEQLIDLGFKYINSDIKTAMYRFNQAFLLDSSNTDIYWGYAGIYMILGDYKNAERQYTEGLSINPKNTHLLTDYATYYMVQYSEASDEENGLKHLESAIKLLTKSFDLDSKDQNTSFKLAVCYFEKNDCENAQKFYKECLSTGGQPITEEFTKALTEQCNMK